MARPLTLELMTSTGPAPLAPKGWQSPMREKDGTVKPLYQCVVETAEGPMKVGPARIKDQTSLFAHALSLAIKAGKINGWGSPTIIRVT